MVPVGVDDLQNAPFAKQIDGGLEFDEPRKKSSKFPNLDLQLLG
jgi:hypothetical protein